METERGFKQNNAKWMRADDEKKASFAKNFFSVTCKF